MEDDDGSTSECNKKWTREQLDELLELYAKEPDLWDSGSRDPVNAQKRQEANERLAEQLACDVFDVITKLRHMRTYYCALLSKMKESESDPSQPPFTIRWRWFHKMDNILRNHVVVKKARHSTDDFDDKSIVKDESEDGPLSLAVESESPVPDNRSTPTSSRKRTPTIRETPRKNNKKPRKQPKPSKRAKNVDLSPAASHIADNGVDGCSKSDAKFGRYVTQKLGLIKGEREKQFVKLQIKNILYNANVGLLNLPDSVLNSLAQLDKQRRSHNVPSH